MTDVNNNQRKSTLAFKQNYLSNHSLRMQKCLLSFILLSIILVGVIIGCFIWIIHLRTKYHIVNGQTINNDTIQYIRDIQIKDNEAIQIWAKKMKNILKKEFKTFKKICVENSLPSLEVTRVPVINNSYKIFFEEIACLEACYKCVEDFPLSTVSLSFILF